MTSVYRNLPIQETSLEKVLDTMGYMIEAENAAAHFYQACAEKFREHSDFWASLAEEEFLHAEAISKLAQLVRRKPQRFAPGNLSPLGALRDFIARTNTKTDKLRSGELTERDALQVAYHIESTVIERKYPEVVSTELPKYNQILDNLALRTQTHKKIVEKRIKKIKAKSRAESRATSPSKEPQEPKSAPFDKVKCAEDEKSLHDEEITPAETFSGHVQDVDILDYIQFVLLTGHPTVLRIVSGDGSEAKLYMTGGKIVHAVSGIAEGEQAFYETVKFKGGSFWHLPWKEPERVSITKLGELLLLEAARRRDEDHSMGL